MAPASAAEGRLREESVVGGQGSEIKARAKVRQVAHLSGEPGVRRLGQNLRERKNTHANTQIFKYLKCRHTFVSNSLIMRV